MTDAKIRQLLVHEAIWPDLVAWLESKGLTVGQIPEMYREEDGLETYVIGISDDLVQKFNDLWKILSTFGMETSINAFQTQQEYLGEAPSYRCLITRHTDCEPAGPDTGCTCRCHTKKTP